MFCIDYCDGARVSLGHTIKSKRRFLLKKVSMVVQAGSSLWILIK